MQISVHISMRTALLLSTVLLLGVILPLSRGEFYVMLAASIPPLWGPGTHMESGPNESPKPDSYPILLSGGTLLKQGISLNKEETRREEDGSYQTRN